MKILAQDISTHEVRTVLKHCLLENIAVKRVGIDKIVPELNEMPVGSVEFVNWYMELAGIEKPRFECYPWETSKFITRDIFHAHAQDVLVFNHDCFVKPHALKLFNGFVVRFDGVYDEHDQEQFNILKANPHALVYVSEVVKFLSEWRYYVADGKIIGEARYDADGQDDALSPDLTIVQAAVDAMSANHKFYTLDFGVLEDGKTELVEANDAWAIGLYGDAMSAKDYANWLINRWQEIDNR